MPTSLGVRRRSLRSNSATTLVFTPSTRPTTATCLATADFWNSAQRRASFRLNTTPEPWPCATPKDSIWLLSDQRFVAFAPTILLLPSFFYYFCISPHVPTNQLVSIFVPPSTLTPTLRRHRRRLYSSHRGLQTHLLLFHKGERNESPSQSKSVREETAVL